MAAAVAAAPVTILEEEAAAQVMGSDAMAVETPQVGSGATAPFEAIQAAMPQVAMGPTSMGAQDRAAAMAFLQAAAAVVQAAQAATAQATTKKAKAAVAAAGAAAAVVDAT